MLLNMERGGPFEIFSVRWATLITCKKKPGVASRLHYPMQYFWYWTKKAIYYILAVWHKGGSPRGEPWGGGCTMLTFTRALLLYISLNIYVNIIYGSLYSPQLSTAKRMNFATSKKDSVIYWHAHLLFPRQGLAASCMMRLMSEISLESIIDNIII